MSTSWEMHYCLFCMLELQKMYFAYLLFYALEGRIGGGKQSNEQLQDVSKHSLRVELRWQVFPSCSVSHVFNKPSSALRGRVAVVKPWGKTVIVFNILNYSLFSY